MTCLRGSCKTPKSDQLVAICLRPTFFFAYRRVDDWLKKSRPETSPALRWSSFVSFATTSSNWNFLCDKERVCYFAKAVDIDFGALSLLGLFGLLVFALRSWNQRFAVPELRVSDLGSFLGQQNGRMRLHTVPFRLLIASLISFGAAFIDPVLTKQVDEKLGREPPPIVTEGIAIYLVLDQSSSMGEAIVTVTPSGRKQTTKEELLKEVTTRFIKGDSAGGLKGRPYDLIGLVTFARVPQVIAPLTLDHAEIIKQLAKLQPVSNKAMDGTAIGYAIEKTANLIAVTRQWISAHKEGEKPPYEIKNAAIVLVTDGFQEINPLDTANPLRTTDLLDAAQYAVEQRVRLYLIIIEPQLASSEYSAYHRILQKMAAITGGKYFLIDSSYNLSGIYGEIDQLEKSKLPFVPPSSPLKRLLELSPYLIVSGMVLLLLAVFLQTFVLRRMP